MAFNRRKIFVTATIVAVIASLAFIAPLITHKVEEYREANALLPRPLAATNDEQLLIFEAVWQELGDRLPPPLPKAGHAGVPAAKSVVLVSSSVTFCSREQARTPRSDACSATSDTFDDFHIDGGFSKKLLAELVLANKASSVLPAPRRNDVILRDRASIDRIFAGPLDWDEFYMKFPGTSGIIETSRAVLTKDRKHALIYVANYCAVLCASGALYYLEHENESWTIVKSLRLWIS